MLSDVRLDEFVRDNRLRYRGPLANDRQSDYQEIMAEIGWGEFPPLKLLRLTEPHEWTEEQETEFGRPGKKLKKHYDEGTLLLIGGFTRALAADAAELASAPAVIEAGDWNDALLLAWHENSTHGRPRDRDEIRAVLDSIHDHPDYRKLGEREIARMAGCSRATVNRYRSESRKKTERINATASPTLLAKIVPLKDAWGRDVPEILEDDFRAVTPARKLIQNLRECATKLLILKYGDAIGTQVKEPGLERIDVKDFEANMLQWADQSDGALPFLVCPHCDGEGVFKDAATKKNNRCETCTGNGYLLRHQADTLKPEEERKARTAAATAA